MITPKQIKALEKRALHLRARIDTAGPEQSSFDVAEHAALMTAIADLKYYQSFEPALSDALASLEILEPEFPRAQLREEILRAWRMMP